LQVSFEADTFENQLDRITLADKIKTEMSDLRHNSISILVGRYLKWDKTNINDWNEHSGYGRYVEYSSENICVIYIDSANISHVMAKVDVGDTLYRTGSKSWPFEHFEGSDVPIFINGELVYDPNSNEEDDIIPF
jgi:hypothetical protein